MPILASVHTDNVVFQAAQVFHHFFTVWTLLRTAVNVSHVNVQEPLVLLDTATDGTHDGNVFGH